MMLIHVNGRPYFAETKPQAVKFLKFWKEQAETTRIKPVRFVRGIERCPSWVPEKLIMDFKIEYETK